MCLSICIMEDLQLLSIQPCKQESRLSAWKHSRAPKVSGKVGWYGTDISFSAFHRLRKGGTQTSLKQPVMRQIKNLL